VSNTELTVLVVVSGHGEQFYEACRLTLREYRELKATFTVPQCARSECDICPEAEPWPGSEAKYPKPRRHFKHWTGRELQFLVLMAREESQQVLVHKVEF
jgi:hypothetical protein